MNNGSSAIILPVDADRKEILRLETTYQMGEDAKVSIRNARRDGIDEFRRKQKDSEITEDELRDSEDEIQKLTDKYTGIIDKEVSEKEKEVMTV